MNLKLKREAKILPIKTLEGKPLQRLQKEIGILAIQQRSEKILVDIKDIIFCKANGNYTEIHLVDNQKLLVSKTLKVLEEKLKTYAFLRTHQSFLVNTTFIAAIGNQVTMKNHTTKPISRGYREKVNYYLSQNTLEI